MKKRVAVFASGSGSNFEQLVNQSRQQDLGFEICALVCNRKKAKVFERSERLGIESTYIGLKNFETKSEYEQEIIRYLKSKDIDLVVLAGYMVIITPVLINEYTILNIHPSLLPKHPGKQGIIDSYNSKDKEMGITIHQVDEGVDTGPIIAQYSFDRTGITLEKAEVRVHELEHENFAKDISKFIKNN